MDAVHVTARPPDVGRVRCDRSRVEGDVRGGAWNDGRPRGDGVNAQRKRNDLRRHEGGAACHGARRRHDALAVECHALATRDMGLASDAMARGSGDMGLVFDAIARAVEDMGTATRDTKCARNDGWGNASHQRRHGLSWGPERVRRPPRSQTREVAGDTSGIRNKRSPERILMLAATTCCERQWGLDALQPWVSCVARGVDERGPGADSARHLMM